MHGNRAEKGVPSHLNILAADLTHLPQETLQLLPQLPLMAWGTSCLM